MNKVAVISGASGFLGAAVAKQLSADGFDLALLYHTMPLTEPGHKNYQCDFSDADAISKTVEQIHKDFGKIDLVVHAAEPKVLRKGLLELTPAEFESKLTPSVLGAFTFLTSIGRIMKAQKSGTIIGVTSEAIEDSEPTKKMGAYIPSKFALHGILRELRGELALFGVSVHEVVPGFMAGGLNSDLPKAAYQIAERIQGPLQTPEDIARIISDISHGI